MGKPTYICPHGHYSILKPNMFSVSTDGVEICCTVCHEKTLISDAQRQRVSRTLDANGSEIHPEFCG